MIFSGRKRDSGGRRRRESGLGLDFDTLYIQPHGIAGFPCHPHGEQSSPGTFFDPLPYPDAANKHTRSQDGLENPLPVAGTWPGENFRWPEHLENTLEMEGSRY